MSRLESFSAGVVDWNVVAVSSVWQRASERVLKVSIYKI
jgi:hypothetical protein